MTFGFSEQQQKYFSEQLVRPLKKLNADIFIFGSRATGEYRKYSDVDVLISPKNKAIEDCVALIKEEFENGNFPFKLDIVFEEDLADSYRSTVTSQKIRIGSKI